MKAIIPIDQIHLIEMKRLMIIKMIEKVIFKMFKMIVLPINDYKNDRKGYLQDVQNDSSSAIHNTKVRK